MERSWGLILCDRVSGEIAGGAIGESVAQLQQSPQNYGDVSTMGWASRTAAAMNKQSCPCYGWQNWRNRTPWSSEDREWFPGIKYWMFNTIREWFFFDLILTVPYFFSLEIRKYLTYCLILQAQTRSITLPWPQLKFLPPGFRSFWIPALTDGLRYGTTAGINASYSRCFQS